MKNLLFWAGRRYNPGMTRLFHRPFPPVLCAIDRAARQPAAVCFAVRDDEKPKPGGMIPRQASLPAEVRKPDDRTVQTADQVIAEIAAKIAAYKPKPEWEGMSPEEMFQRGCEHEDREEYAEAVKWYHRAAEQGLAKAQELLGEMYRNGQDYAEAAKWYRRAAEQGDASAQYNLGRMYRKGEGVPQDHAETAKWYRRAAEQGHDHAQYCLGRKYAWGESVPQDYAEAAKWYRRAAEQGHVYAQYFLGLLYRHGEGVPQDEEVAEKWLSIAADAAPGQGHTLKEGEEMLFRGYRHNAERGNAEAQYNLGVAYRKGEGVTQDDAEAAKWFRRAAEQGNSAAQRALRELEQGEQS